MFARFFRYIERRPKRGLLFLLLLFFPIVFIVARIIYFYNAIIGTSVSETISIIVSIVVFSAVGFYVIIIFRFIELVLRGKISKSSTLEKKYIAIKKFLERLL